MGKDELMDPLKDWWEMFENYNSSIRADDND